MLRLYQKLCSILKIVPNPSSKARLTTGHGAFRRLWRGAAPLTIFRQRRICPRHDKFFFGGNDSGLNYIQEGERALVGPRDTQTFFVYSSRIVLASLFLVPLYFVPFDFENLDTFLAGNLEAKEVYMGQEK
ncbi:hypothetical protein HYW73_03945 [Candidatus Nomurabacteria bacterium]|nr:hypothetical protein [Candidatus Nomurabacteria bacterium]